MPLQRRAVVDGVDIITGGFYCEKRRADVCMPVAGGCNGEMSLCTMTATALKAFDAPTTADTPAQGPSYALDRCGCTQCVPRHAGRTCGGLGLHGRCRVPHGRPRDREPRPTLTQ